MTIRVRHPLAQAAALVALLLLSYAFVRSTVMQAAMASPAAAAAMPMCGDAAMASTAKAPWPASRGAPAAASKSCPYCAVAAHLPVVGDDAPSLSAAPAVFVTYVASPLNGPRGPPACRSRARDPPLPA